MTSRQFLLDKTGIWASSLCAAHCISVPAVMSMSGFSSWTFLHGERIENVVLMLSGFIAVCSLIPSYLKGHKRLVPVVILLSGFLLIGLSRFMVNVNESILTSSGAALVASAHFLNYRYCKQVHSV